MEQIIVALDLGTSKSIAIAIRKDSSGRLSVLDTETVSSREAIRRGRVYHSEDTFDIVSELIGKLSNSSETMHVEKIYVGIGGQSLHTQLFSTRKIVGDKSVTPELLDSIEKEANEYKPEFENNFGIVSREYYADGQPVSHPKGVLTSVLEARFQLIVGNPCLKRNLENVLSKLKDIFVEDYFISPLATAEAVLTPEEKKSGCALIEFGEGVTYVSVYKDKGLKYMAAIPLGGLAITKDIRSLNVSEEEAKGLKNKYGNALSNSNDSGTVPANEEQDSSRKVELKDLNWIIECRVNEIVANISEQIGISGYSKMLDAGIVITGGGALLQNLPQYIRNQTGKEVRLASAKVWMNEAETQLSPADSCVLGLAILGKENCAKIIVKEEVEVKSYIDFGPEEIVTESNFGKKLKGFLNKGVKNVIKGVDKGGNMLFSDEDFDKPVAQSNDKNQNKNRNLTHVTNK